MHVLTLSSTQCKKYRTVGCQIFAFVYERKLKQLGTKPVSVFNVRKL